MHPAAAKIIEDVGVDVVSLVDFSEFIYKDCDALAFDHFVELLLEMRDTRMASVKDIHYLRKFFTKEFKRSLSDAVEEMVDQVRQIIGVSEDLEHSRTRSLNTEKNNCNLGSKLHS